MNEYQVSFKVYTGNFLPPYALEGVEFYEAETAAEAVKMAQAQFRKEALGRFDPDEHPLNITDVKKL